MFAGIVLASTLNLKSEEMSTAVAVADPLACVQEKCPNEWAACQKDPKCVPALQACDKKCGTSATCWTFCLPGKGSQAAIDVAKCAQKNGCLAQTAPEMSSVAITPVACAKNKCPTEWAACQRDPKCASALQSCQQRCANSSSCWTSCLPSKGSQAAIDLMKCAQTHSCLNQTAPEMSTAVVVAAPLDCIKAKCPSEYAACQNDPKCSQALQGCQDKCGNNITCWTFCLGGKGSNASVPLLLCAKNNSCLNEPAPEVSTTIAVADPIACVQEKCPNEYAECQKDPKCLPALQACQKKCGTGTTCWTFCLGGKGSQGAIDVAKCAQKNGCLNQTAPEVPTAIAVAAPLDCIKAKCPNQWAVCTQDPKCQPALQDCQNKCGNNVSCWTFCIPGKQDQAATDVAKCGRDNHCLGPNVTTPMSTAVVVADPIACVQEKCPNEYAECQKDPKCLPALQACQKKCGTGTTCWTFCLGGKGSQGAIDVAKCAQKNGCLNQTAPEVSTAITLFDPQQCVEQKCPTQWAVCVQDAKCQPALQFCQDKCGANYTCWDFCIPGRSDAAATDVAKCARENKCLGSNDVTPFQECMARSCTNQVTECLSDDICSGFVSHCKKTCKLNASCEFDCMLNKRVFSPLLNNYFTCSGEKKCI